MYSLLWYYYYAFTVFFLYSMKKNTFFFHYYIHNKCVMDMQIWFYIFMSYFFCTLLKFFIPCPWYPDIHALFPGMVQESKKILPSMVQVYLTTKLDYTLEWLFFICCLKIIGIIVFLIVYRLLYSNVQSLDFCSPETRTSTVYPKIINNH